MCHNKAAQASNGWIVAKKKSSLCYCSEVLYRHTEHFFEDDHASLRPASTNARANSSVTPRSAACRVRKDISRSVPWTFTIPSRSYQRSSARSLLLLKTSSNSKTSNEVDLQCCPLKAIERTRERARERVGNIQVFTYLRQWTDRSLIIGGISDLYAVRVQSSAEFISQVFAVLALEEQESHFLIIGL